MRATTPPMIDSSTTGVTSTRLPVTRDNCSVTARCSSSDSGTAVVTWVSGFLPDVGTIINGFTWVVCLITAVGVALSFTPLRRLEVLRRIVEDGRGVGEAAVEDHREDRRIVLVVGGDLDALVRDLLGR